MSSNHPTPTIDALRHTGRWPESLDHLVDWDPQWTERCATMTNNPWTTGVLPVKWIELICVALNAACTLRNEPGVQRHVRAALDAGATPDEILATFKGVSVLGIHSVAVTLPILFEEAELAGVTPDPDRAKEVLTPVIDQLKRGGEFNTAWDSIYELDARWLEEFLAMGADVYSGVLPAKLVELMSIAVDASCTHLYLPGIRRHVQRAFAEGATIEEIMDVLKLCGGLGVDACELGVPILAAELANQSVA